MIAPRVGRRPAQRVQARVVGHRQPGRRADSASPRSEPTPTCCSSTEIVPSSGSPRPRCDWTPRCPDSRPCSDRRPPSAIGFVPAGNGLLRQQTCHPVSARNTETVWPRLFATTTSSRPSRSRSADATSTGCAPTSRNVAAEKPPVPLFRFNATQTRSSELNSFGSEPTAEHVRCRRRRSGRRSPRDGPRRSPPHRRSHANVPSPLAQVDVRAEPPATARSRWPSPLKSAVSTSSPRRLST